MHERANGVDDCFSRARSSKHPSLQAFATAQIQIDLNESKKFALKCAVLVLWQLTLTFYLCFYSLLVIVSNC